MEVGLIIINGSFDVKFVKLKKGDEDDEVGFL